MSRNIATVVLSGGQDSTTCLGYALAKYGAGNVRAVSFDYGQKHAIELEAARAVVRHFETAYDMPLGIEHEVIELGPIFAGRSPLTNSAEALDTYTDAETMAAEIGDRVETTFVPMRNAVFLMLAANRAVCADSYTLVTGVCQADNANYPDCRNEFVAMAQATINEALGTDAWVAERLRGGAGDDAVHTRDSLAQRLDVGLDAARVAFVVDTPLIYTSKAESIELALRMPHTYEALAYSHTAYDGLYPPVGGDHASVLRADGFTRAGVPDPLVMRAAVDGLMELPTSDNYAAVRGVWHATGKREFNAAEFARGWRAVRRFDDLETPSDLEPAGAR